MATVIQPTSEETQPRGSVRTYWYVTAQFIGRLQDDTGAWADRPLSTAHAKSPGGTTAACGIPVAGGSWRRIFDLPFPVSGGDVCADCLAVVTAKP